MTSPTRTARSTHYDGAFYGRVVAPLLAGIHGFVAEVLPPGERVLDACCGTGDLARRLAASGRQVAAVDLSPRNIDYARRRAAAAGLGENRLAFQVADVAQLQVPAEGAYDVATVVLALHEMPAAGRTAVIEALTRAARRVLLVDFAVPMPRNLAGLRNRALELAAGPEHFRAFRDYTRRGGLTALVAQAGAELEWERTLDGGTLRAILVKAPGSS